MLQKCDLCGFSCEVNKLCFYYGVWLCEACIGWLKEKKSREKEVLKSTKKRGENE